MTQKEVEKIVTENNLDMKDFYKFIENQTVGVNDDGSTNFYETDVERFVRIGKQENKTAVGTIFD